MNEPSLEKAQTDIQILLANIDYFVDEVGEELGEEDRAIIEQIRKDWA